MAVGSATSSSNSATRQVVVDPLQPTADDGWSPATVTAVRSKNDRGFAGAALRFTLGGVDERPGQRLSVAQVDALAPFFATQFGLDEGFVRHELAKVYIYVGGPAIADQAMTVGSHVYVPNDASLNLILSTRGRRWLTHELAHTMQYAAYQNGSPHRFLADYILSSAIGTDPHKPGTGDGRRVWGSAFTALRSAGHPEDAIGTKATTFRDRVASGVLPATAVSIPVALTLSSGLATTRATTGLPLLGSGKAWTVGLGAIAAPAIAGSLVGTWGDTLGYTPTQALGAVGGGALAGAALWHSGAFRAGGESAVSAVGRTVGRSAGLVAAAAVTLGGAAIGLLAARTSANTARGWSSSAQQLRSMQDYRSNDSAHKLTYEEALHDSHWMEIDAETLARTYVRDEWTHPTDGAGPVTGATPAAPTTFADKVDASFSDRMDWGVKLPLLIGIPAAIAAGTGVLAARTGGTLLRSVRHNTGAADGVRAVLLQLGSQRRGMSNSFGVGAAVTVAPLVAGGLAGPIVGDVTDSATAARIGGAAAGALTAGVALPWFLRGRGGTLMSTSGKVAAGMAIAGAMGLIAGGVGNDALHPKERRYVVG